mmetsp:Transcript_81835/g.264243  ORF Transcript_81835/g.264243 Transcript_81835/m.264243 type:complete len:174 (+) Transcript_81835:179-700(+)
MGKVLQLQEGSSDLPPEAAGVAGGAAKTATKTPLERVLRSKGLIWMDTQPQDALYWSHAGRCARFSTCGRWTQPAAADPSPAADAGAAAFGSGRAGAAVAAAGWSPEALDLPRNELVFIGAGLDEVAIRTMLDSCLATEEELSVMMTMQAKFAARAAAAEAAATAPPAAHAGA